ncbi:MAG: hypothetical protein A2V66_01175 [Ignavibacteria bacterium RBG_13_36_8]|nr:MAG: hypothetical protein A2V66_01175 [Ignavibacteria bacterium RBG_13_36_8]
MIIAAIFALHLIFILIIFTKKYQEESLSTAFQNVVLIIILFFVGWPLVTMIIKIFIEPKGLGVHFDRDTIVLTALSVIEYLFYKMYYKEYFITEAGKGRR